MTGSARFISAESARSVLQPAADGSLPTLALEAAETKRRVEQPQTSTSPALMAGAIAFSIISSMLLLLVDLSPGVSVSQQQADARHELQWRFTQNHHRGCPAWDGPRGVCTCDPKLEVLPYQELLREAHQAFARGEVEREQQAYRRVWRLLKQDTLTRHGLTGSETQPNRDRELEELLGKVLRSD